MRSDMIISLKKVYWLVIIGVAIVIIGTFLIFQLEIKQSEQGTYTTPMNVTEVIHNLDNLYDKHITVSGYWYDTYPSGVQDGMHCQLGEPNTKPIYDNSTYVAPRGGGNYLSSMASERGDILSFSLPHNALLFEDVRHRDDFVTVSGILEKYYVCADTHYYKSAILNVTLASTLDKQ